MISKPDPTRADARARELLQTARRVLLFGHERPDGDVLGSQVGLAWALAERGAEVSIVNPDPPDAPFDFLEPPLRFEAYTGEASLPDHDLAVMLDCSELSRAGELGQALRRGGAPLVVIDHHVLPAEPWWDAALHDPTAAATGMLVWRWIRASSLPLCPPQAIGLFTAIATDTGWFRHPNTDAEVLEAASELVRAGAYPDRIHRALFRRRKVEHT
ncbi:MAG: DHH family phosphoesterase, partial [Planctomycetota bacterium]